MKKYLFIVLLIGVCFGQTKDENAGKIIESAGFRIVAMKKTKLSTDLASTFYEVHKEKPFFKELIDYMSSGPIIAAILEKDDAVTEFRKLIGSTNPKDAAEGTIRSIFAESLSKNAIHGSDSNENAQLEANFHFSFEERY